MTNAEKNIAPCNVLVVYVVRVYSYIFIHTKLQYLYIKRVLVLYTRICVFLVVPVFVLKKPHCDDLVSAIKLTCIVNVAITESYRGVSY